MRPQRHCSRPLRPTPCRRSKSSGCRSPANRAFKRAPACSSPPRTCTTRRLTAARSSMAPPDSGA
jgi:hypothetical protein